MWTVHQPKPRTASPRMIRLIALFTLLLTFTLILETITFLDNPPGPQQTQLLTPSSTPEPKSSARRLSISELVSTDNHFNKVNTLQTAVDTIKRAALPINAVLTFDQTGDGEYLLSARPWEVAECRRANQELWNQLESPVRVPAPVPVVPAVQPVALSYLTPPSSPEPRSKRNLVPIERVSAPNEPDSTDLPADPVLTYDSLEYLSDYDQDEWAVESVCSEPEELPAVCTPEPISPSGCLENEELYANPKRPISPNPSSPTSCHLSLEESTMVVPLKVWAKSPNPKVEDLTSQLDLSCFPEWPIARGGFGEIWKGALTPSSGKNPRPIAVKRLTMYSAAGDEGAKKIRKRTARELAIWSSVNHPNILPLMGTCSFRGSVGLVSEWQDNGNAIEWVRANPGANRPELCEGICAGLKYLHDSGIVHGDLRGGNVMISKGGKPRLIDFGLASITDCSVFSASSTLAGTLRWMAPELQATEGQGPTKPGDMFAFAMTMLELFTGLPPFSAVRNDIAVLLKYQKGERPPRPSLTKNTLKSQKNRAETRSNTPRGSQFRDICVPMDTETWFQVQKCWDQNPLRRPSANEMLEWFMLKKKRRPSELD